MNREPDESSSSGVTSAVPDSLVEKINGILHAADEFEPEDAHAATILCEQAYIMAQNLDPNTEGRGVLMSLIKQKLDKKDGGRRDRNRDAQHLWDLYQRYSRRHKADEIRGENHGRLNSEYIDMAQETEKIITTLQALSDVLEVLHKVGADIYGADIYGADKYKNPNPEETPLATIWRDRLQKACDVRETHSKRCSSFTSLSSQSTPREPRDGNPSVKLLLKHLWDSTLKELKDANISYINPARFSALEEHRRRFQSVGKEYTELSDLWKKCGDIDAVFNKPTVLDMLGNFVKLNMTESKTPMEPKSKRPYHKKIGPKDNYHTKILK